MITEPRIKCGNSEDKSVSVAAVGTWKTCSTSEARYGTVRQGNGIVVDAADAEVLRHLRTAHE